jgi:hypothetical protein
MPFFFGRLDKDEYTVAQNIILVNITDYDS